jgi:hypothetical protein
MDVQSFSYDYWAYDAYHFGQSQWKPVGGGEAGSCTVDRGEYGQNHSKNSGYDSFGSGLWDCVQSSWAPAAASPFVYGNFLWTGFDCECAPARADVQSPNDMWCGVVWCGVVWCGVVWCGVVWCGACVGEFPPRARPSVHVNVAHSTALPRFDQPHARFPTRVAAQLAFYSPRVGDE